QRQLGAVDPATAAAAGNGVHRGRRGAPRRFGQRPASARQARREGRAHLAVIGRCLLALAGALALTGCGAQEQKWPPPSPALWEVTGGGGAEGWLVGPSHPPPRGGGGAA